MVAVLTKVFDNISVDETKSAKVTPRGDDNTLIVHAHDSVTAGVVVIEGSPTAPEPNDPELWETLATRTLTGDGTFHDLVAAGAYRFLRARVETVIAGGTVDAWILSAPARYGGVSERDLSTKAAV